MTLPPAVPRDDRARRPLVSVIVPSYNGAKFLPESLDSILAQTYPNIEIIVLDDASTDDTPAVAARYAGRITYVRQPANLGQFDNVNDGIARATGEFVAVYHADDIYLPEIVEREVAYLQEHPDVAAVFASDIFVDAAGREYGRLRLPPEVRGEQPLDYVTVLNALLTYKNRFLVGPSAMVRGSVYASVGRYREERYRIASDLEMWMRIARRRPIAVLEDHLMKYRHFHGNASQQFEFLRTGPDAYFFLMDDYLDSGDRALARPDAMAHFEAHRMEDRLMSVISHYIKGELREGRQLLGLVRLGALLRSRQVQRWRLVVLTLGLRVLVRLPRIDWVARRMFGRWHVKRPPA
jgi:glycosyltransferase involved in cell wall biosynthesis